MKTLKQTFFAASVITLCTLGAFAQDLKERDSEQAKAPALDGTWDVTVTVLSDCTVKRETPLRFAALLAFARGGTISGTTTNPAFPPGSRSSDYGVWSRGDGAHQYRAISKAFIYADTPAFKAGAQVIEQAIDVTDSDHFKSDAVTRFYDTNGNPYRTLCASASAVRFQ